MTERGSWLGQKKTSRYITDRLQTLGIKNNLHSYYHKRMNWYNIIATLSGSKYNDISFLIVAHYDSKNRRSSDDAPGADDNASGIAALLELAEIIKQQPFQTKIQFVFTSNEEYGHSGSRAYAKDLRKGGMQIGGVMIIDVVGYYNASTIFSKEPFSILFDGFSTVRKAKMICKMIYNIILAVIYPGKSLKLGVRDLDLHLMPSEYKKKKIYNHIKWVIGDKKSSGEETSFWSEGFSAVYLNALHRNPYWHTYRDRLEYLDLNTIEHAIWFSHSLLSYWDRNIS